MTNLGDFDRKTLLTALESVKTLLEQNGSEQAGGWHRAEKKPPSDSFISGHQHRRSSATGSGTPGFQQAFQKFDATLHAVKQPKVRVKPIHFPVRVHDAQSGINIRPQGESGKSSDKPTDRGSGGVDLHRAYALVLPKHQGFRFTYHYRWSKQNHAYIGFYHLNRDKSLPMCIYTGGDGHGSRTFDIPAQPEDSTYIIYGQHRRSNPAGASPWVQVPARLLPGSAHTISFNDDHSQKSEIGWISWSILN